MKAPHVKQGDRVEFKWYGNRDLLYIGRIEMKDGEAYFVPEHCYDGDNIKPFEEPMRFYNPIDSFFDFTHFNIIV